jgi:hypothetical protein
VLQASSVETLTHDTATSKHIPTAEYQSLLARDDANSVRVAEYRLTDHLPRQLQGSLPTAEELEKEISRLGKLPDGGRRVCVTASAPPQRASTASCW